MFYIISYDIPDDGRRNKLAKVLKGFGTRVQYSVFEAHRNKTEFKELKREVGILLILQKIPSAAMHSVRRVSNE